MAYDAGKLAFLVLRPSNLLLLLALAGVLGLVLGGGGRPDPDRLGPGMVLAPSARGRWLTEPLEDRFPAPPPEIGHVDGDRRSRRRTSTPGSPRRAASRAFARPWSGSPRSRSWLGAIPDAQISVHGRRPPGRAARWLTEARVIGRFLAAQGVPEGRVVLEDRARSTRDNALFSLPLGRPQAGRAVAIGDLGHAHAARHGGIPRRRLARAPCPGRSTIARPAARGPCASPAWARGWPSSMMRPTSGTASSTIGCWVIPTLCFLPHGAVRTLMRAALAALLLAVTPAAAGEPPARDPVRRGDHAEPRSNQRPSAATPKVVSPGARHCRPTDRAGKRCAYPGNRTWGHPELIAFIERLSVAAHGRRLVGTSGWRHGATPRRPHAHRPRVAPDRARRRSVADAHARPAADGRRARDAVRSLNAGRGTRTVDPTRFIDTQMALIRRAALDPEVARIFVHPGHQAGDVRAGRRRSRLAREGPALVGPRHPFPCPAPLSARQSLCRNQEPPPEGDGCGQDLAWWLRDEPWKPKPPGPAPKPLVLADLPSECAAVLKAHGTGTGG